MLSCGDFGGILKEELLTCLMACLIIHMYTVGRHDKSQCNQFLAPIRVDILLTLDTFSILQDSKTNTAITKWVRPRGKRGFSFLYKHFALCSVQYISFE
jgi:hypothetical protein